MSEASSQGVSGSAQPPPDPDARKRRGRVLAGILLLALAVRALTLAAAWGAAPVHDEATYLMRAVALLDGRGLQGSFQSWVRHPGRDLEQLPQYNGALQGPGYPAFLAAALAVGGRDPRAARVAQSLLGVLVVFWTYLLAQRWLGPGEALLAALICALYPDLIAFSHLLWAETLFLALFLPALWLLSQGLAAGSPPSARASLVAGALLGLAALTRGSGVLLAALLPIWLVVVHPNARRGGLGRAALLLLAAALVIAPWTLRNARVLGGFALIDTNGAYNVWRGNAPETFAERGEPGTLTYEWPFQSLPVRPVGNVGGAELVRAMMRETGEPAPDDLAIRRYAGRSALRFIAEDPVAFLARARLKLLDLWNPTSFLMRHFLVGGYGPAPPMVRHLAGAAAVLAYALLMGFGAAGLVLARRRPGAWLVVWMALLVSATSAMAFGLTRFRLPLLPLLAIFAAHAALCGARRYGSAPASR